MARPHSPSPTRRTRRFRWSILVTTIAVVGQAGLAAAGPLGVDAAEDTAPAAGTVYYIDATGGNDAASGLDTENAWQSLERVNQTEFQPGDRILLKADERWAGQLWPKGSGADGAPITIDSYGAGAKPRIDGEGVVDDAVRLFNQEYWTIRNLEVTNAAPATGTPGENLGDLRGIHVSGDTSQVLDGIVIDSVDVHDVTGEVNWIGGSSDGDRPGITFQTGWDRSKNTGGIVFTTTVPDIQDPPDTATVFNDVTIENSTIANTSFAGITFKQYTGDLKDADGVPIATPTGWGTRRSPEDPAFTPHTNIVIRNNYVTQAATAYGCNGMYITNVRGALVERNVVHRTGTSGIETYHADDVTIQFNEVYETQQKAGGADSNGIDPDTGTTNQLVQYNYVHDNGDGILLCQCGAAFGDAVVRNNVIASNTRYQIYLHSVPAARAEIYNNTIYNDASDYLIYGYGQFLDAEYDIRNNVLYSTRAHATLTTSPTITYENNLYGGAELMIPEGDAAAVVSDPLFVDPAIDGPYGTPNTGPQLETAFGLAVRSGSAAISTGVLVDDNGGRDFAGTQLYNGGADIGAFEYTTPAGADTESITGIVRDTDGAPVPGVTVSADAVEGEAVTGADGRFALREIPFADGVVVTATHEGYETAAVTVDVRFGNTTTVELEIASTSVVGTVTGRVLDQAARPVTGATVSISDDTQVVGTTATGDDGTFAVEEVPIGSGYTVTAAAPGHAPAERIGVTVRPAAVVDVGALLVVDPATDYLTVHDFDALEPGTLPTGTDGVAVSPSGGSVDVVERPDGTGLAAKLTRTVNSGSTSLSRSFSPALTGIVTVEADIMRDDPYISGANWFGVPYIRGSNGLNAVSIAFSRNTIVAYSGTQSITIGEYELGRWYRVAAVLDTVNQRFDLYLDGVQIFDDAGFRNPLDGVAQVDYYANSSNYGSVHIDNVRVSQGIGYAADEADLAALTTDHGMPVPAGGAHYVLDVPVRVTEVEVGAQARSPFAQSVTVAGVRLGDDGSHRVRLRGIDVTVPVVVTAEDGSTATHTLQIRRRPRPDAG